MNISDTQLKGVLLIQAKKHGDARGWFCETFRHQALIEAGFSGGNFIQDNHVRSTGRGILRGLHFQSPPHAQDKLIRCVRGAIFDVALDIRRSSPSFGQWTGAELSADNNAQLLVPKGFAHGYLTLSEDCEVLYKVTDYYAPDSEGGLAWNDPAVGIKWPIDPANIITNDRDGRAPRLADIVSPFA